MLLHSFFNHLTNDMAGHSKWANIKYRKSINDAKRGKLFGKLVKEISSAAKQGGSVAESNPRLRLAIQNAKNANLPKGNIEKAIKKGSSGKADDYIEVAYEGYAAHGVAIIVECITDNPSRTVAAVRAIFTKYKGNLGKSGSLSFLFDRKGVFSLLQENVPDEEALTLAMIEACATAIKSEIEFLHITCPLEAFGQVQKVLETLLLPIEEATLQYIPRTSVVLANDAASRVIKLIEALEDDDDVQRVSHNMS